MTRLRRSLRVAVMTSIVAGMVSIGVTAPVGAAPINTTVVTIPNPVARRRTRSSGLPSSPLAM